MRGLMQQDQLTITGILRRAVSFHPNQQLVIPAVAGITGIAVANTTAPAQTGRGIGQYTVRSGDTLSGIAAYAYGNGNAWWGIYQANAGQISNPDLIFPGQVLAIP